MSKEVEIKKLMLHIYNIKLGVSKLHWSAPNKWTSSLPQLKLKSDLWKNKPGFNIPYLDIVPNNYIAAAITRYFINEYKLLDLTLGQLKCKLFIVFSLTGSYFISGVYTARFKLDFNWSVHYLQLIYMWF